MTPANLRVLKAEASSGNIPGLEDQKDHFSHRSPLAVVPDVSERRMRRRKSWANRLSLSGLASRLSVSSMDEADTDTPKRAPLIRAKTSYHETRNSAEEDADDEFYPVKEHEKPIAERVLYTAESVRQKQSELEVVVEEESSKALQAQKTRTGTRLTMTSRSGYFADRVVSPAMVGEKLCIMNHLTPNNYR